MLVRVDKYEQKLSNLEKVFWQEENITKGDLIKYYLDIHEYLLPHLKSRPLVMKRYPDGIRGEFFYQKECPNYAPEWINKITIEEKTMIVVDNIDTLIWCINLACIELHPWLSSIPNPQYPDILVFDLDPEPPAMFVHTLEVAFKIKKLLEAANLKGFPKTSGNEGLHIYVPIFPQYPFSIIKEVLKNLCIYLVDAFPGLVTMELIKEKRRGKVYLDYLQNGYGKTMASVYSVRPTENAPVSTPLSWKEIEKGVNHKDFNIFTIKRRLDEKGDLFAPVFKEKQDFTPFVDILFENKQDF
jgi:bifunctional non-homologous end joining protein LigD